MATYILKKDGKLYNKATNKQNSVTYIGAVAYYFVFVDGKSRALQTDPYLILKSYYPTGEYNIEIDEDAVEDDLFMMHLRYQKEKRMKCGRTDQEYIRYVKSRLWEDVVKNEKTYLFKK